MREVKGYICLAVPGPESSHSVKELMFGPNPKAKSIGEDSICTFPADPVKMFQTRADAEAARQELKKNEHEFSSVSIGLLEMKIADDPNEVEYFKRKGNLVVMVVSRPGSAIRDVRILGANVEGCHNAYPLAGADLEDNGLVTFDSYRPAWWTLREAIRQSQHRCYLSTFKLKRLKR